VDGQRIALWGDSFTPPNGAATNFKVPHAEGGWPTSPEPLGGLLGLLGALYEDDVRAVFVSGGLTSYHSVLTHFGVLVPHDASVPGALTAGDLCDLAATLAPRPLHFAGMVDHLNRPAPVDQVRKTYASTIQSYAATPARLAFAEQPSSANW